MYLAQRKKTQQVRDPKVGPTANCGQMMFIKPWMYSLINVDGNFSQLSEKTEIDTAARCHGLAEKDTLVAGDALLAPSVPAGRCHLCLLESQGTKFHIDRCEIREFSFFPAEIFESSEKCLPRAWKRHGEGRLVEGV